MEKIISESGKEAIAAFVRENLHGNVSDETIQSYVYMAESQMKIREGLPSLEISMCFSLSGMSEYLDFEPSDVTYRDCVLEGTEKVAEIFGNETAAAVSGAKDPVRAAYDGYLFAVAPAGDGKSYTVKCLGPDGGAEK